MTGGLVDAAVIMGVVMINSPPGAFDVVYPNTIHTELDPLLQWSAAADADDYDLVVATDVALSNVIYSQTGLAGTSDQMPAGLLERCVTYYWGVTANNAYGSTDDRLVVRQAVIWGAGLALQMPTASNDALGTKRWSAGP